MFRINDPDAKKWNETTTFRASISHTNIVDKLLTGIQVLQKQEGLRARNTDAIRRGRCHFSAVPPPPPPPHTHTHTFHVLLRPMVA